MQLDAKRGRLQALERVVPGVEAQGERQRRSPAREIREELGGERLDPPHRILSRIVVGQPGDRLEDLGERPVGDALAVREAATDEDACAVEPPDQLADKAALAHSGLAVDGHEVGSPLGDDTLLQPEEELEFPVTTDERGAHAGEPADLCIPLLVDQQGTRAPRLPCRGAAAHRALRT